MESEKGNAVERELINKATGEVHKVQATAIGNEEITFTIDTGDVTFQNPNRSGDLSNNEWDVREIAQ